MIKKILFIAIILLSITVFSQEKSISNLITSPNPFIKSTTISFNSNQKQDIFLIVKNVLGKTVYKKTYFVSKGAKEIVFDRNNLKPGMYIYAIQSNKEVISKRFVIR